MQSGEEESRDGNTGATVGLALPQTRAGAGGVSACR